jgi:hypothetical protein
MSIGEHNFLGMMLRFANKAGQMKFSVALLSTKAGVLVLCKAVVKVIIVFKALTPCTNTAQTHQTFAPPPTNELELRQNPARPSHPERLLVPCFSGCELGEPSYHMLGEPRLPVPLAPPLLPSC